MKPIILCITIVLLISCNKQVNKNNSNQTKHFMSLGEVMKKNIFENNIDNVKPIKSEIKSNKTKKLFKISSKAEWNIFRYFIIDYTEGISNFQTAVKILSKEQFDTSNSLFELSQEIVIYNKPHSLLKSTATAEKSGITGLINGIRYFFTQENLARLISTDEIVCIDWYWTTWNSETGEIISNEFLFQTCNSNNTFGGGGGQTEVNNCVASIDIGNSTSEFLSSELESSSSETISSRLTWSFYKGFTFKWKSTEKGVLRKVNNHPTSYRWESLTHVGKSFEGFFAGGDMECTISQVNTSCSPDQPTAWVYLDYDITISVVCKGSPLIIGTGTKFAMHQFTKAQVLGLSPVN